VREEEGRKGEQEDSKQDERESNESNERERPKEVTYTSFVGTALRERKANLVVC
jgi:hypothetical protein